MNRLIYFLTTKNMSICFLKETLLVLLIFASVTTPLPPSQMMQVHQEIPTIYIP